MIDTSFHPKGFASPTFNVPEGLDKILKDLGFQYQADLLSLKSSCIDKESGVIPQIGINLYGDPGGVAFFEYCRCNGMNDGAILEDIKANISNNEITVLYDHPYYAGTKELELISRIIQEIGKMDVQIVRLDELI